MAMKNEKTSRKLAKLASKGMRAPSSLTTKEIRSLAACVLTQVAAQQATAEMDLIFGAEEMP